MIELLKNADFVLKEDDVIPKKKQNQKKSKKNAKKMGICKAKLWTKDKSNNSQKKKKQPVKFDPQRLKKTEVQKPTII